MQVGNLEIQYNNQVENCKQIQIALDKEESEFKHFKKKEFGDVLKKLELEVYMTNSL